MYGWQLEMGVVGPLTSLTLRVDTLTLQDAQRVSWKARGSRTELESGD